MKSPDCPTGKKKYTKRQAAQSARWLKYKKKRSGMIPTAYTCKVCGHWHVGNLEERMER